MTTKDEYVLSNYEELTTFGNHNNIFLVKNKLDGMLYIKKVLYDYKIEVYEQLKRNRIEGIPEIYEIIEDDGKLIIIEDYIHGKTLDQIELPVSISDAKKIALSLCATLKRLHHLNPPIVHRDIKPGNVIITKEENIFLVDFNISRQYNSGKEKDTVVMGTSGYAAPEQFGITQTDGRADIYSIGMLLKNITQSDRMLLTKEERYFNNIVKKCISIGPEGRYQSCAQLEAAINKTRLFDQNYGYMIPGFRSKKIWKMIVAIIGYAFIIFTALNMEASSSDGTKVEVWEHVILKISVLFSGIFTVFFTCNWCGIGNIIPTKSNENILVRMIKVTLTAIISFTVIAIVLIVLCVLIFNR